MPEDRPDAHAGADRVQEDRVGAADRHRLHAGRHRHHLPGRLHTAVEEARGLNAFVRLVKLFDNFCLLVYVKTDLYL